MTQPYDLSKCAIGGEDAVFTDADPGANPVSYCSYHLPEHLRERALDGQLPLADTTRVTLSGQASELGIEGRSSMKKDELAAAVSRAVAEGELTPVTVDEVEIAPTPPAVAEVESSQQYVTEQVEGNEGGSMTDAPVASVEADVESDTDADEEPKTTKRSRKR